MTKAFKKTIVDLSDNWLQSAEGRMTGKHSDNLEILAFLLKRYGKQTIDFQDMMNSVEELCADYPDLLNQFYTLFGGDQRVQLPVQVESRSNKRSSTTKEIGINRKKSVVDADKSVISSIGYIVQSLAKHQDALPILYPDGVIHPAFEAVVTKSSSNQYQQLAALQADMDFLWTELEAHQLPIDRVRKHYMYLVDYYFPSLSRGKTRSKVEGR